jgi:tRNA-2-methylthio-N6-dimethylallyladenosine synthase
MANKKVYIKTYGCQMNVYDTERMQDVLAPLGYAPADKPEGADLIILNTCHIREKAEDKVYSDLGRLRREKVQGQREGRQPIIAVGGCVGQAAGEEIIRRAPYVDMVFGPQSYHKLPDMLSDAERQSKVIELDFPAISKFDALPEPSVSKAGSAFLSVQEGCDKFCTFCVVPYTRGAEYSRPVQQVLEEALKLAAQGVIEITLLGQNVNAYHGVDASGNEWGLGRLIYALAEIDGLKRIRYTTSHPRDMDEELIRAHGEVPQLMPFLHLPVQSGSDRVLKAMNRKHTAAEYLNIIEKLRAARPDIAFSSDFIVGFPGETEAEFQDTLRLVETVGFAQSYSFRYSARPGTPAAEDENQIPIDAQEARLAELQALITRQQKAFNQRMVGQVMPVLFEKPGKIPGQLIGKTPYLQSVHVRDAGNRIGQLAEIAITDAFDNSLAGIFADNPVVNAFPPLQRSA